MKDRNVHLFAQLRFDHETFRRLDVLKVDAAKGRFQHGDRVDEIFDIGFGHLDVEDVDAGEFLEEDRLAFHHRLGGKRPDVAEPQNGSAVGNDRNQIAARCVIRGLGRIVGDLKAGRGHTRGIGQCQVALVAERLDCLDLQFPGPRMLVIRTGLLLSDRFRWSYCHS